MPKRAATTQIINNRTVLYTLITLVRLDDTMQSIRQGSLLGITVTALGIALKIGRASASEARQVGIRGITIPFIYVSDGCVYKP